jgi:hypothetical protein
MQKFVLTIELGETMRSPDDIARAVRQAADQVRAGHGTGKVRDRFNRFTGEFDIVDVPKIRTMCEFCKSVNVPIVATLDADPDQRVCADCHADPRLPTTALTGN